MDLKLIRAVFLPVLLFVTILGCSASARGPVQVDSDLPVNSAHMYSTVQFMTEIQPARNHKNLVSLNKTARFIKEKFSQFGYAPIEQKYFVNGSEYKNVIASYGPGEAPRFIVGAHYDVYGDLPGADDNASGVAGLLELARLFKLEKPELKYRVDFVAFTLEEPPYFRTEKMGSYIHAKWLNDTGVRLIGMVSLEMIGFYTEAPKSQDYPTIAMKPFYPSTGDFIAVVGNLNSGDLVRHFEDHLNATALKTESLKAPAVVPGVDFSDHLNYWKFKKKAIMITDTSFYRNNNYHKATDTIDTLDFSKMAVVVKGVYQALLNLGLGFQ